LSHTLFEEDAIAVYLFVKTRHPEAAKIVLQRDNGIYCSSLEVKDFQRSLAQSFKKFDEKNK
jgi:hypothetical protein